MLGVSEGFTGCWLRGVTLPSFRLELPFKFLRAAFQTTGPQKIRGPLPKVPPGLPLHGPTLTFSLPMYSPIVPMPNGQAIHNATANHLHSASCYSRLINCCLNIMLGY